MKAANIQLLNIDCMDYMRGLPSNAFELAIVDPPYGIGGGNYGKGFKGGPATTHMKQGKPDYDTGRPPRKYFDELQRVAKNCIVWGGNHFADLLPPSAAWIVWNKKTAKGLTLSDCELAYTTIGGRVALYTQGWNGYRREGEHYGQRTYAARIHPNQKPVALYRWLLAKHASAGDRILDTHVGSGSIAIACHDLGFDLVGCELDRDYYEGAIKRLQLYQSQLTLL